jgi:hypothetical protein
MPEQGNSLATSGTDGSSADVLYTRSDDERPSRSVVAAVAEATGADPKTMPPLYDVVDPDALDQLFGSDTGESSRNDGVSFRFSGCGVTVYADGRTAVSRPTVFACPDPPGDLGVLAGRNRPASDCLLALRPPAAAARLGLTQ